MSITDYVIDILLIAVIFHQVLKHELTARSAVLPLALGAISGLADSVRLGADGTRITRAPAP